MKLKRYEAKTEDEAVAQIREELGETALILSVRTIHPTGFFWFLKKTKIEVTAAYDHDEPEEPAISNKDGPEMVDMDTGPDLALERDKLLFDQMAKSKKISEQQARIESLETELKSMTNKLTVSSFKQKPEKVYDNRLMQIFYDTLASQNVMPEIASEILDEIISKGGNIEGDINTAVKLVYNKILQILSKATDDKPIAAKSETGSSRTVMLMGPTGVGKTTTIAKLSSNYILQDNCSVGLITADTYRIAAVEQLKTYADILGIEVGVVYEPQELSEQLNKMLNFNDIIIIDTAGRSHKNRENFDELKLMISAVDHVNMEKYLVLSMTSKIEDMLDIIEKFSEMCEFRLILTKLDETSSYGSILNICYKTGIKVDYLTTGQNVPDDIERMAPEKIAKALLGMEGVL